MRCVEQLRPNDLGALEAGSTLICSCLPIHDDAWGDQDLRKRVNHFLSGFHMKYGMFFEEQDDYQYGMRADHFTIEVGFSECADPLPDCESQNDFNAYPWFIVVFANHKGTRCVSIRRISSEVSRILELTSH